jgi:adenine phosphoribosyltransferase
VARAGATDVAPESREGRANGVSESVGEVEETPPWRLRRRRLFGPTRFVEPDTGTDGSHAGVPEFGSKFDRDSSANGRMLSRQYRHALTHDRVNRHVLFLTPGTDVMDLLRRSLLDAPIIEKGDYEYFVHPISDGVPMLKPALLREIVIRIIRKAEIEDVDKIVTPAAMGIHISTAVSLMTDIPLVVIRKRQYGLDGEVSLHQTTGYSDSEMYINDVYEGDTVLVLDDVLSTGGTMKAILDALNHIGADVVDVVAVIKKAGPNKLDDTDYSVKTLINVTVEDGEVVIVDEHGDD